jgi:hypothetical protein
MPDTIKDKAKRFISRKEDDLWQMKNILDRNRKFLIIVADPKTDLVTISYDGKYATALIKNTSGKKSNVVRRVLHKSTFGGAIDQFIASLSERMKCSVEDGNVFWQFIDGALFNISKLVSSPKKVEMTDVKNV